MQKNLVFIVFLLVPLTLSFSPHHRLYHPLSSTKWTIQDTNQPTVSRYKRYSNIKLEFSVNEAMNVIDSTDTTFLSIESIVLSEGITKYWFMFPTSMFVAFCAITAGIGGAALYGPIFLIAFPLLGPEYPLQSPTEAIGTAILVETCGFSSGLIGYFKRKLIDVKLALQLAIFSVPAAILSSEYLRLPEVTLKGCYSVLMITLSLILLTDSASSSSSSETNNPSNSKLSKSSVSDTSASSVQSDLFRSSGNRIIVDSDGKSLSYPEPNLSLSNIMSMVGGGTLCGLLGVGVGELVLPQLLGKQIPVAVAAATSTLVVTLTAASCAEVQVSALIQAGGLAAVPWALVGYMIPGVIIGAQIASRVQGRGYITQKTTGTSDWIIISCDWDWLCNPFCKTILSVGRLVETEIPTETSLT